LKKQQTCFKRPISIEGRVAMSLARLGSGDGLRMVGEVYGVAESKNFKNYQKIL
jgi:hypothetical protein